MSTSVYLNSCSRVWLLSFSSPVQRLRVLLLLRTRGLGGSLVHRYHQFSFVVTILFYFLSLFSSIFFATIAVMPPFSAYESNNKPIASLRRFYSCFIYSDMTDWFNRISPLSQCLHLVTLRLYALFRQAAHHAIGYFTRVKRVEAHIKELEGKLLLFKLARASADT